MVTLLFLILTSCTCILPVNESNTNAQSIYSVEVMDSSGKRTTLEKYRGKVILITNIALKCGTTPQLKDLEDLYAQFKDQGLVVLGFPSSSFSPNEPIDPSLIKNTCATKYNVNFPIYHSGDVSGDNTQPLFTFLTSSTQNDLRGPVNFNFEKFLISKEGFVKFRYGSFTSAVSSRIKGDLKTLL